MVRATVFSRRAEIPGNHNNLLLASAGQDTYVKLWKIEECNASEDDEELSVTKNKFTIETADHGENALL